MDINTTKGARIGQGNTAEIFQHGIGKIRKLLCRGMHKNCEEKFSKTEEIARLRVWAPEHEGKVLLRLIQNLRKVRSAD